jgi:transposase
MKIIIDKYKKVADFCYKLFRLAKIPIYSNKFSNKLYTSFQHLFLLIYKQFRRFTYEELLTDLASNKDLKNYLALRKLPHYSTLIKFSKRLPLKILDKLVLSFREIIPQPKRVAIDATGISLDNASLHYCKRIEKKVGKRPFMKTTFIVDIETYIILLCNQRKKARHDTIDAKPMIIKLSKYYKPNILYADRGYDSENIFKICFEKLKAYPLILQRRLDVPKHRRHGTYRKLTIDVFDYGEYLQRNKIETVNSMFKKRFGSKVKSRNVKSQKIEILTRVIAYNIDRLLRITENYILLIIKITRVSQ